MKVIDAKPKTAAEPLVGGDGHRRLPGRRRDRRDDRGLGRIQAVLAAGVDGRLAVAEAGGVLAAGGGEGVWLIMAGIVSEVTTPKHPGVKVLKQLLTLRTM